MSRSPQRKPIHELVPSAKRLIQSLREVGYDFVHAVADIVDNSVEANASRVAIEMRFDGEDSWVRIADNGTGMSGSTITEAMRFGTQREYKAHEMGRFGLGLKTASLSQCSRLTVASRTNRQARRIEVRQWDLEHIKATDRWEIIDIASSERPEIIVEPLKDAVGTVVLWEQLDRVITYRVPWGDRARSSFFRLAEELELHLAMVFHRFLSEEARRRKRLKITLNGNDLEPWDPYARDEKGTVRLPTIQIDVSGDDGTGLVAYTPYVLPSQERFSSLKAFNRCAGPGKWNFQQGFYIYRADRMIQSGGWCRMRTSDEHTKLARVALDFWPDLDSAFEVNVAKARVTLPADLRSQLKPHVEDLVKRARKAYAPARSRSDSLSGPNGSAVRTVICATPPDSDLEQHFEQARRGIDEKPATYQLSDTPARKLGLVLESAAQKAGEVHALNKIKRILKADDPEAAQEIGW